jgi:hypothetical protein
MGSAGATPSHSKLSLRILLPVALLLLALALPATARASGSCRGIGGLWHPFASWSDMRWYGLAPAGSFESEGSGWTLRGGARLRSPGAPFVSPGVVTALHLPPGGSATSGRVCVTRHDRLVRMFARASGTPAKLRLDVVTADGARWAGNARPASGWDATPAIGIDPRGANWLRFRLTARGHSALDVDDLYIDPYRRH